LSGVLGGSKKKEVGALKAAKKKKDWKKGGGRGQGTSNGASRGKSATRGVRSKAWISHLLNKKKEMSSHRET